MQNQLNMANRKIREKEEVIAGFMKLLVGKSSSPNWANFMHNCFWREKKVLLEVSKKKAILKFQMNLY